LEFFAREDFWTIEAARSEDETEIRAGERTGGRCNQGHPTGGASALFGPRRRSASCWKGCAARTAFPPSDASSKVSLNGL
jgi:hypothetical protein